MKVEQIRAESWLEEHGDFLYAYALKRLRDRSRAEEAVQETLVSALTASSKFDGRSSVRTWLCGILRHKVVDQFRLMAREEQLTYGEDGASLDDLFDLAGHYKHSVRNFKTPSLLLENQEFLEQFHACLDRVPERQARVFVLRELEDLESGEICKVLKISSTNFWVMLHRARLALRACLEKNWFGQVDERP